MSRIYLSAPDITGAEEQAVVRALRSGWVAPLGPEVDAFEAELAAFTGRQHAVALSSGTAALHLGLLELGAAPDSVVLTSTMTFAATANAIVYTGASPVFVDSDESGNLDPDLLAKALADQRAQGSEVAAVLPVDLIGKVADHDAIRLVAQEHDVPVLVDAAESLGAVRDGRPAGSDGVLAAVSFNGNKVMTTSGGGALLCDDEALAQRIRYLASQARQPVVHYEHTEIGYNYRMSNLLAALGRVQLERLPAMIERRRCWRRRYRELFGPVAGVQVHGGPDGLDSSDEHDNFWLTSIRVEPDAAGWTAEDLRQHLEADDIEARPLWKPMHMQPVFARHPAYLNGTGERLFRSGLSLPSGSGLSTGDFDRIVGSIGRFVHSRA
jgi:dTDP-4-amino-4,6-dideoxygalactose transaminase